MAAPHEQVRSITCMSCRATHSPRCRHQAHGEGAESFMMSATAPRRPRRAAAVEAEQLTRALRESLLLHNADGSFADIPPDDDDDDTSYAPSNAKRRRLSGYQPDLPPGVSSSSSLAAPTSSAELKEDVTAGSDSFDLWDQDPRDVRHQRSRLTGCFVISPLYRLPDGFVDLQTASAQQLQLEHDLAQPLTGHEQRSRSSSSADGHRRGRQPGSNARSLTIAPSSPPAPSLSSASASGTRVLLPSGLTSLSPSEPVPSLQARDAALSSSLSSLSDYFSTLITSSHRSTFTAIASWLSAANRPADEYWSLGNRLPAAFVCCGVDVDDHPQLFSQLAEWLTAEQQRPAVSCRCLPLLLSASSCATVDKAVQHVLLSYISQFPSSSASSSRSLRSSSSDSHFLYSHTQHTHRVKRIAKELWHSLAVWWRELQQEEAEGEGRETRLLLIFTDPHSLDPAVLTQLLYALMSHPLLLHLPWCLMFALGIDGRVMRGVGERVSSRLKVTSFQLASSASLLAPVRTSLLLSPSAELPLPLLSPSTLSFLLDSYAAEHSSLSSWHTALRLLLCDYFASVPYSQLAHSCRTGSGEEAVSALTDAEVEDMQRLFGSDGTGGAGHARGGAEELAGYRAKVLQWLQQFEAARQRFVLGCRLLHAAASLLLNNSASIRTDETAVLMQVYAHMEAEQPAGAAAVASSSSSSATSSPTLETLPLYAAVVQALRSLPTACVLPALRELSQLLRQQSETAAPAAFGQALDAAVLRIQAGDAAAKQAVSARGGKAPKPVRATNQRERLRIQTGGAAAADQERAASRAELVAACSSFFSSHLTRLSSLPLSSLFLLNSASLPSLLCFDPQAAVTAALSSPSSEELQPDMDDVRILFRLYCEAGLRISLPQWFASFCSVFVSQTAAGGSDCSQRDAQARGRRAAEEADEAGDGFIEQIDEQLRKELFVRFSVCVDAMRWCGLLRPDTRRKGREAATMIKLLFD